MKWRYDQETDSLFIKLRESSYLESEEIAEGFIVDFDAQGNVVALDIQHASEKLDLQGIEMYGLRMPIRLHDAQEEPV